MSRARRVQRIVIVAIAGLVLGGAGGWLGTSSSRGAIAAPSCKAWRLVTSPPVFGTLYGINGTSSSDVWAVGSAAGAYPIIEHWDGSTWSQIPQSGTDGYAADIAAVSPTDVWLVGQLNNGGFPQTLAEHWDGSVWTIVPSPSPGHDTFFTGVSAISSDDVWATGSYQSPNGALQPLFEHWDGSAWTQFPPAPGTTKSGGVIYGMFATSTNDVWAVGYKGTPVAFAYDPLIEHWDGTAWSQVKGAPLPPGASGGQNILNGIWASASNDAWAVGSLALGLGHPLLEHWDGSAWNIVKEQSYGGLKGVSGVSSTDIWAVGGKATDTAYPLTEHWDGTSWLVVGAPNPTNNSSLAGVAEISSTDIWGVGLDNTGAMILHSMGPCPRLTP